MKRLNRAKNAFGFFILMLLAISCKKDFLDVTPKGAQLVNNVNDYDKLLNITYLINSASIGPVAEVLGDEVNASDPWLLSGGLRSIAAFKYQADIYQPTDVAPEMQMFMKDLYTYNLVINNVSAAPGTAASGESAAAIKSEAMADRAWSYLQFINYFGKPYNAATASNDPGYPIITTADVTTKNFDRSSVQAVYDFIIHDLTYGIPALPTGLSNRYRMSKPAAEALLGKVYWFMGKYDQALVEFNAAFSDLTQSGSLPVSLYNLANEMTPTGVYHYVPNSTQFTLISGITPNVNNETLFSRSYSTLEALFPTALLSVASKNLYTASDQRLKFFSSSSIGGAQLIDANGDMRRIGPLTMELGITLPDMYLMRAECEARTGATAAAINDLQTLRKKRMSAADATIPSSITGDQLIQFILDERIREFACQGFRWFDMRRLSTDPKFAGAVYTHTYYSTAGTQTFTLKQPDRFTLKFPQIIIDQNPGMVNNP